ncbi:hypothetical protein [Streptomyces muensis]|uniref:Fibronectin type-III domain-containing protein n=1 Tax=Streptomyces muensis TaxID=1077944 RepID=A0A9X1Q042_STRM4|nr:hypothetical protein [Streptomyces muensis]MCF1594876.1 hypothetical protein [Streptomyces muensis]
MRPTGNHLTGYLAVCAVGALIGTSLAVGAGASGTRPELADVGAWLTGAKGEIVHAHGLTGEVDGKAALPAGMAGHPVSVAQNGRTTLVLDEGTGQVVRIDAAQLTAAQSADHGAAGLQLVSGGAYAYVVDPARGTVQRIDPARTTAESPPVPLEGKPGAAVVDGEGTLWVPLPESGTVVPFVEGLKGTAVKVADAGHDLTLTVADGRPVVTDGTAAATKVLSATGVRGAFDLGDAFAGADPADVLVPAGTDGSAVPVLAAGTGDLVVVDVHSRHTMRVRVPTEGHALGAPQLLGERVYIPDESTGRLLVYDTAASTPTEPVPISEGPGELELFVQDGLLWVNDPDGAAAAVIDADGEVRHIRKYGTEVPSAREPGDEPVEDGVPTGAPAGQVPPRADVPGAAAPGSGTPSGGASNVPSGGTSGPPGPTQPAPEPGAPGAPQAESRSGAIRITFAEALGATPQRYVLKGAARDQTVTPDTVGPDGPFVFEVSGGSCEKQYSFTVVAEYGGGRPDKESARSALARPCIAPGAPRELAFTPAPGGHGGTVTWQPPQDTEGSVRYTINGPGGMAETRGRSHSYENLPNGRISSVAVMATNAAGSGAAVSGWIDLTPPPQKMNIVNNKPDGGSVGIRSEPHSTNGIRVGRIPAGENPEVTVHCKTKGEAIPHDSETTDVWARHTYYDPDTDKNITGYTSDHWVNSRSNPDVWECE